MLAKQNQLEKTRLFLAKQPQGAQHVSYQLDVFDDATIAKKTGLTQNQVCTLRQANIGKLTDHTGGL